MKKKTDEKKTQQEENYLLLFLYCNAYRFLLRALASQHKKNMFSMFIS